MYYTKRGSAWFLVREVRSIRGRGRERERERERGKVRRKWRHKSSAGEALTLSFTLAKFAHFCWIQIVTIVSPWIHTSTSVARKIALFAPYLCLNSQVVFIPSSNQGLTHHLVFYYTKRRSVWWDQLRLDRWSAWIWERRRSPWQKRSRKMGKWLEFGRGSAFSKNLGCFPLLVSLEIFTSRSSGLFFIGNCWVGCRFCPRTRRSRSTSRRRDDFAQWLQCSQVNWSSWEVYLFWIYVVPYSGPLPQSGPRPYKRSKRPL